MWEITILGDVSDFVYFAMLEEDLKKKLDSKIVVAMSITSSLACSIALKDKKYLSLVKDLIYECIVKCAKDEYFRENIHIDGDNSIKELIHTFLIYVNLRDEIEYAKDRVNLPRKVYIRSLVRFRLRKLYRIWDRFIYYFHQKDLSENVVYLDFLKLLATSSHKNGEILFLEKIKDNMCILDKNKEILHISSISDEIGVVVSLITLSPKRIIINCVNALSVSILQLLNYIFEDRISMLL